MSMLGIIEAGGTPRRSAVLGRALAALALISSENDHDPAANRAVGKVGDGDARPSG
jgi:hypothetical protein